MYKKIFSAILFGAFTLASTSTFVSCKDYDDDITDLQEQINTLKGVVDQKETTINSTIKALEASLAETEKELADAIAKGDAATLKAAQDAAQAALDKAKADLEKAIADGDADAIKKAQDALDKAKADLTKAYQDGDAATLAAAKEAIKAAKEELEKAIADGDAAERKALEDAKKELKKAQEDGDAATLAAAKKLVEDAQKALDDKIAKLEKKHDDDKADLLKKIADLDAALVKAKADLEAAIALKADKKDLEKVSNDLANHIKDYGVLNDKVTKHLTDFETYKTTVKGQIDALDTKIGNLETKHNNELKVVRDSLTRVRADLTDLGQRLNKAIDAEVTRVNGLFDITNGNLADLKTAFESHADSIDNVTYQIEQQLVGIRGRLDTAEGKISALDAKIDVIAQILAKKLRSLVYMPNLYVGGIETIEYPFLNYSTIHETNKFEWVRPSDQKKILEVTDYTVTNATKEKDFGPTWAVDYHMNPGKAPVKYADVKGYNVRTAEVVTRAALSITSPETYADGTPVFKNQNGILTVGLKVADPKALASYPTNQPAGENEDGVQSSNENIIALQVYADKDTIITSDYAMLLAEKTFVEGIVWNKAPLKGTKDEACTIDQTITHVWDDPREALNADPDLELYYASNGLDLAPYLGIHYVREAITKNAVKLGTWAYGDAEQLRYGLTYSFSLVDYKIDGNKTIDSHYATLNGSTIIPGNVDAAGNYVATKSETSVGREPLVRVLVKRGTDVLLDGYIKLRITTKDPEEPGKDNLLVDQYPAGKADFDLCNAADALQTNWSQFSAWVLTDKLENMTKENFDAQYTIDGTNTGRTLADGGEIWDAKVYENTDGKAATVPGKVEYYFNSQSQTNHAWKWSFTEDELEAITHDKKVEEYEKGIRETRYIRFIGSAAAKYPYIYVKLETVISRATVANVTTAEKNTNYWFAQDGNDEGLDAIIFNVNQPLDGGTTTQFNRDILTTYKGNALTVAPAVADKKFFFAPKNTSIKALNGKTYTITPKANATDEKWNAFVCLYDLHKSAKYTTHKWGTDAQNKSILEKCAISYEDGLFTNNALYAMNNNVYTKIAEMNQATGLISLIQNDAAKDVLNAIGYVENHANIMTEFHTFVGIAAKQNCAAVNVENGSFANFVVSWQRPINLRDNGNQQVVDAKTNGNYIYAYEFLRFFDFRGPVAGDMEGANKWLWAYYNIKSIALDCTPSKVKTNMHQTNKNTFVALNTITTKAELGCFQNGSVKRSKVTYNFNISSYNSHDKNQALLDYMEANKELFGVLYYANNGDNVEEFDVQIPVEVTYEWGTFYSTVTVNIKRTLGN